ncbi:MAG: DUF362 domain-containing protein [Clostridiales bacterium]|nr:DUF362 domain-containing protein [Clostridiales bacterium]
MSKNKITVIYGHDIENMVIRLCEENNLASLIPNNVQVGLKPNFVVAKPASQGATTHIEILEGIIKYLHQNKITDINIMESAWIGASTSDTFKVSGATRLAEKYRVKLTDLKQDKKINLEGIDVCCTAVECGFLINLPVLKGHCQTHMTCALKNMKGCIPDTEKRAFHTKGLHEPIGHLGQILKPHFTIVDGICGDLTFEEGGNPLPMDRLISGFDSVQIDSYVCQLMGLAVSDVAYIKIAESYGAGTSHIDSSTVVELNEPKDEKIPNSNRNFQKFDQYINQDSACSACYGSLIFALSHMDKSRLYAYNKKINIGQGFINKNIDGIGIGNCCSDCTSYVKGCPPTATTIRYHLEEKLK